MHFDQPIPFLPTPFRMLHIPGGTFRMGSPPGTPDSNDNERPDHDVTLSDFWLGELPVTQDLWQAVMGGNPSGFKALRRPVEQVSWDDAQDFIQKLNSLTNKTYRLPTEAEWEYAALGGPNPPSASAERAGGRVAGFQYAGSDLLPQVGWYGENSDKQTHEAGLLLPNELGLYDMSGNVWEWCNDWYAAYPALAQTNPTGPTEGSRRVYRGGSWSSFAGGCRVSRRYDGSPEYRDGYLGFRLASSPQ